MPAVLDDFVSGATNLCKRHGRHTIECPATATSSRKFVRTDRRILGAEKRRGGAVCSWDDLEGSRGWALRLKYCSRGRRSRKSTSYEPSSPKARSAVS